MLLALTASIPVVRFSMMPGTGLSRAWRQAPMVEFAVLVVVIGLLLVLGLFVEATSMIILLSPILVPLVTALGLDPPHFGVIFTMSIMIAVISPPVGICSYIAGSIAGVGMHRLVREMIPHVVAMVVFLFVLAFVPSLSTFLPSLFFDELP